MLDHDHTSGNRLRRNLSYPLLSTLTILLQLLQQLLWRTLPIPLRVILRPPPQILTRILQCSLSFPSQLLIGSLRIRRQIQHVSSPPPHNLIWQLFPHGSTERLDHVENGASLARPEVPGAHAGLVVAEVVEGDEVALCEVEDVDVVADGGAVVGGVVVAKDEQLFALPDGHLGEQREEVVRDALGVFAHDAAGVRAGRVEVAQEGGVPVVAGFALFLEVAALGFDVVGDAGFDGGFGAAVGVGWADGAGFGNGYHVVEAGGVAVDGGR